VVKTRVAAAGQVAMQATSGEPMAGTRVAGEWVVGESVAMEVATATIDWAVSAGTG
jgi:hypothetical protein